jgi:hypothetical protein
MPINTSKVRSSGGGMVIGRPASEAAATARIEPDRKPAGMPRKPSVSPPAAAKAKVSATRRRIVVRLTGDGADKAR